jgi:integrase
MTIKVRQAQHKQALAADSPGRAPSGSCERLGHSSIVMTLDTYSHVLPSMLQAATEKLEKMLFGSVGTL